MTDPLAARVHALIAEFRNRPNEHFFATYHVDRFIDALEAALAAAREPDEDKEPDYPIGEPWTEAQLADMRAMALKGDLRSARELLERHGFTVTAALAAALAPNPEPE